MSNRPKILPALLFAAAGAGLFLGVGAALPNWVAPRDPAGEDGSILWQPHGPLWEAVPATLRWRQWMREQGAPMPLLHLQDQEIQGPLLLLACGAGVGLLVYAGYRSCARGSTADPPGRPQRLA